MPPEFFGEDNRKNNKNKNTRNTKFLGSLAGAIFVFMLITAVYLVVAGLPEDAPAVSISELAKSVAVGEVSKILVQGESLAVTYRDGTVKKSMKEAGTSLSETLTNYGVSKEALESTDIEIKNER